jgi:hypothetical protein
VHSTVQGAGVLCNANTCVEGGSLWSGAHKQHNCAMARGLMIGECVCVGGGVLHSHQAHARWQSTLTPSTADDAR